jgi:hypothetical protein
MKAIQKYCVTKENRAPLFSKHGQALVETALLISLMMLLVMGILFFGEWGSRNYKAMIDARNDCDISMWKKIMQSDALDIIMDMANLFSTIKIPEFLGAPPDRPISKYMERNKYIRREVRRFLTRGVSMEIKDGYAKGTATAHLSSDYLKIRGKPLEIGKKHNFYMEKDDWRYRLGDCPPSIMNTITRLYLMSEVVNRSMASKTGTKGKPSLFEYKTFSYWRAMDLFYYKLEKKGKILSSLKPKNIKNSIKELFED